MGPSRVHALGIKLPPRDELREIALACDFLDEQFACIETAGKKNRSFTIRRNEGKQARDPAWLHLYHARLQYAKYPQKGSIALLMSDSWFHNHVKLPSIPPRPSGMVEATRVGGIHYDPGSPRIATASAPCSSILRQT